MNRLKEIVVAFAGFTALLLLVYAPYLTMEAIHHDNVRYFSEDLSPAYKSTCSNDPQFGWLMLLGRPAAAYLECIPFSQATSVNRLLVTRYFVGIELAVLLTLIFASLTRAGMNRMTAAMASVLVGMLPVFQNAVLMTNFVNITTPFLAFIAGRSMELGFRKRGAIRIVSTAVSLILLISTMYAYPALSFFYFLPLGISVVWARRIDILQAAAHFATFGVASLFYMKFTHVFMPQKYSSSLANLPAQFRTEIHLTASIHRVMTEGLNALDQVLSGALASFPFSIGSYIAGAFGIAVAVSLALPIGKNRTAIIFEAITLMMLVSVGMLPWMLAPGHYETRILGSAGAAGVLLTIWAIQQVCARLSDRQVIQSQAQNIALALFALPVVLITSNTTLENARSIRDEEMFVRTEIAMHAGKLRRVHVVLPVQSSGGLDGRESVSDEFYVPTTRFSNDVPDVVRNAMLGLRPDALARVSRCPANLDIARCVSFASRPDRTMVTTSTPGEPICSSEGTIVIDMNHAFRIIRDHTTEGVSAPAYASACSEALPFQITASYPSETFPAEFAFDGSTDSFKFWEVSISMPVALNLTFPQGVELISLTLESGITSSRMPRRFRLLKRGKDGTSKQIQTYSTEVWELHQKRTFPVPVDAGKASEWTIEFQEAGTEPILRIDEIKLEWK